MPKIRSILCSLLTLVILAACGSVKLSPSMKSVDKSWYQLTDSYADHRQHQSYFATENGKIAYLDLKKSIDAPVLVLLHGVPSSSWLYRKMLPELQQHYRVIAVDLLGYGSSDKPDMDGQLYKREAQATYVQDLLGFLRVDEYSLAFHDMGGLVAWEMIDRALSSNKSSYQSDDEDSDQKITTLFVLNTIIAKEGFNHPNIKKGARARVMSNAFSSAVTSSAALEITFNNMGLRSDASLSEAECFGYVAPMKEGSNHALYDFYTGFDDALFSRLEQQIKGLERFTGQAHILWGAQDKVLTTEQIPVLTQALSKASVSTKIFEANAHFLPEEIPNILAAQFIQAKYNKANE